VKKKIIILGSTGSIGEQLLDILKVKKNIFKIELLSTNQNLDKIILQAKTFNVKNIIINNPLVYLEAKKKFKNLNINIYNSFLILNKLFKKNELYYSMNSIVGIEGLSPIMNLIKISKNLAIANKESIICGWRLIKKELIKHNTNFIPVDSEHFSIFSLLNDKNLNLKNNIRKVYITASGGPFLNYSFKSLKKVDKKKALNHPTWKMGNKITIDSSTMMNKVFEVIEAKKLFNLNYNQIKVLIHPKSYVHAIVKFKNAITKILIHEPDMKIPIYNSLSIDLSHDLPTKKLNIDILNDLKLANINSKQFPLINTLKNLRENDSYYETALIVINDFYVKKFLNNQISYYKLIKLIIKHTNSSFFLKFRNKQPKKINDIIKFKNFVSSKLSKLSIE